MLITRSYHEVTTNMTYQPLTQRLLRTTSTGPPHIRQVTYMWKPRRCPQRGTPEESTYHHVFCIASHFAMQLLTVCLGIQRIRHLRAFGINDVLSSEPLLRYA